MSPKSVKYLKNLNEPIKSRIKSALTKLEQEPPQGNIKAMSGHEGFRLRVGSYRILFGIRNDTIVITDIGLRGQIYRGR